MNCPSACDVLVVGAGPAGSETAYRLARRGFDVVVIERGELDREKPCGGGIVVGELVAFGRPPASVIERTIEAARVIGPSGQALTVRTTEQGLTGITVRRSRYDRYLQERAAAAGARVVAHHTLVAVGRDGDRVRATVATPAGTVEIAARLLVHAAGWRCRPLDDALALTRFAPADLAVTCQVWRALDPAEIDRRYGRAIEFAFDENRLPRGYAWAFPKNGFVAVGLGTTQEVANARRLNLRTLLDETCRTGPLADRLAGSTPQRVDGGCIPLAIRPALVRDRALLVGDAAGLGNIIHGGGIFEARTAAVFAAEHAERFLRTGRQSALDEYGPRVREHFEEHEGRWDRRLRPFLERNVLLDFMIRTSDNGDGGIAQAVGIVLGSTESHRRAYEILEAKMLDAISDELVRTIEDYRPELEAELARLFPGATRLDTMARHTLLAEAKRLRAALVVLAAEAVGGTRDAARPVAIAYELSHTASLVHDDIIDANDRRRGAPTLHRTYGIENAIITGDALLIKAFELLERYAGQPAIDKARLCQLLKSGTSFGLEAARGQVEELELQERRDYASLPAYLRMVRRKTGALIAAATEAGALVGGAPDVPCRALARYGRALGIAFQIVDDSRDLLAAEQTSLKSRYNDFRLGKPTPMLAHVLPRATALEREFLLARLGDRTVADADIERAIAIYRAHGSLEFTQRLVRRFVGRAQEALDVLPPTRARQTLFEIADIIGFWALLSTD